MDDLKPTPSSPNQCRWCLVYTHPVRSLVEDHEAKCVARPSEPR